MVNNSITGHQDPSSGSLQSFHFFFDHHLFLFPTTNFISVVLPAFLCLFYYTKWFSNLVVFDLINLVTLSMNFNIFILATLNYFYKQFINHDRLLDMFFINFCIWLTGLSFPGTWCLEILQYGSKFTSIFVSFCFCVSPIFVSFAKFQVYLQAYLYICVDY